MKIRRSVLSWLRASMQKAKCSLVSTDSAEIAVARAEEGVTDGTKLEMVSALRLESGFRWHHIEPSPPALLDAVSSSSRSCVSDVSAASGRHLHENALGVCSMKITLDSTGNHTQHTALVAFGGQRYTGKLWTYS